MTALPILAILSALFVLLHVLTRKHGEDWLRQEGYLPRTPEEIRAEAMEERASREQLASRYSTYSD